MKIADLRARGWLLAALAAASLLWLPACASQPASEAATPVAAITSPEANSKAVPGQEMLITFNAADVKGIARIELAVDGRVILADQVEPPVNSYTASQRWTATEAGTHVIELTAYNVDNVASSPAKVVLTVGSSVAPATPLPIETPPSPAAADTPTLPPAPPTSTPAPTPTSSEPTVTALVGLNARQGPGTNYPVVGSLDEGEPVLITGRNEQGGWWQIAFSHSGGDRAWVSAAPELSTARNTGNVPLVVAPPPPIIVNPTDTPSPRPTIFRFTADRSRVAAGEKVTLSWDLANARVAFLRFNGVEEGVVAPGSKTVAPDKTTKYILVAVNDAGETTAELTVEVSGTAPTPVPVLRQGDLPVSKDQYVDFDQGEARSESGNGADFFWDGDEQRFAPRNGASGALLDRSFDKITLEDCRTVAYGLPVTVQPASGRIAGCYVTSDDRYGKFLVTKWDQAANLTIQYLTWDFRR